MIVAMRWRDIIDLENKRSQNLPTILCSMMRDTVKYGAEFSGLSDWIDTWYPQLENRIQKGRH